MFGDKRREKIERIGHFKWSEVVKINIKDALIVRLADGDQITVPLEELDFVKRKACRHCTDYAAEFADLAFGGIGAEDGWTTVVARTELGMRILAEARQTVLEEHEDMAIPDFVRRIRESIELHSQRKKDQAQRNAERLCAGVRQIHGILVRSHRHGLLTRHDRPPMRGQMADACAAPGSPKKR